METPTARTTRSAESPCSSRTRSDGDGRSRTRGAHAGRSAVADALGAAAAGGQPGPDGDQPRAEPSLDAGRAAPRVTLDGETVVGLHNELGYVHTGIEK